MNKYARIGLVLVIVALTGMRCKKKEPSAPGDGTPGNHPPSVPSDPAPPDSATNQGIDLTLYWTGGDPDPGDTVTYNICFDVGTPPAVVATGLTTNSYDPGSLSYSVQYYWRVEAKDNHDATSQGPIWSFTTGPSPQVPPPTNLQMQAVGSDSLSLRLFWDPPGEPVDGFIVSFMGSVLDTVATSDYSHVPASLGTYSVKAYRGAYTSTAIETTSTLHEEVGEGPVYWLVDPDPAHPSGYGWDADGTGSTYSVQPMNKDHIDLVLDAVEDLRSPADTFGGDWHLTGIAYDGSWTYSSMTVAPQSGYSVSQNAILQGVYVLYLESGHYLKLEITDYDPMMHSMKFRYGFQRIPGFRRLG